MLEKYKKFRVANWRRLDNAAKIFPSTTNRRNTRMFRFSSTLFEEINPEILQSAVESALEIFPSFQCVMKKGFFWYYLEDCEIVPKVVPESREFCSQLYTPDKPSLLFEVSYFKNRINLEMFHVLADGTGAMQFLKTILRDYIYKAHPESFGANPPELDYDASDAQKSADAFAKYYKKEKSVKTRKHRAFHIGGRKREAGNLQAIQGVVSAKKVIEKAHIYNTSLTVFLTAIYISAIHEEMNFLQQRLPVVIMVPVNLRQYFPSQTARNFFGMIAVKYDFSKHSGEFTDIITAVDECFRSELTKDKLSVRMNKLASLEHNFAARIAPLPFKNFVLMIGRKIGEGRETAVISNVGRITMPPELSEFISGFDVYASTSKLQLCLCSFGDKLALCFTSNFEETEIQRRFFRFLTDLEIPLTISANDYYADDNNDKEG